MIERKANDWYTTGSTISRRARELYLEDKLDRKFENGHAYYKLKEIL